MQNMKSFADYKQDAPNWITMANGEFYPDILADACELYKPVACIVRTDFEILRVIG